MSEVLRHNPIKARRIEIEPCIVSDARWHSYIVPRHIVDVPVLAILLHAYSLWLAGEGKCDIATKC